MTPPPWRGVPPGWPPAREKEGHRRYRSGGSAAKTRSPGWSRSWPAGAPPTSPVRPSMSPAARASTSDSSDLGFLTGKRPGSVGSVIVPAISVRFPGGAVLDGMRPQGGPVTITQARWNELGAYDIHLIPGQTSPRLLDLLEYFDDRNGRWYTYVSIEDQPHMSVRFSAGFLGAPSAFGGTLDPLRGDVAVAAPLPAGPRLRSFIVTATVNNGTTAFSTTIRIYVHASLTRRWLTPTELSVRQGAKNMRFSVFGQFDDGVIGDITNWGQMIPPPYPNHIVWVHKTGSTKPIHGWSLDHVIPAPGTVTVDPVTGELTSFASGGGGTAHIVDELGHVLASAPVYAAPAWSTPVKLQRVSGPGFDAMTKPRIRNVLFLPDGFVDDVDGADRLAFESYVRKVVTLLRTNVFTRPYDLLESHFNFFSAWVPSPQAGVAPLNEFLFSDELTETD